MKYLLLVIFSCYFSISLMAQSGPLPTTITGKVVDSISRNVVPFATVVLQNSKTHETFKSSPTAMDGSFILKINTAEPLELAIIYVGYQSRIMILNESGKAIDLGTIFLMPSSNQLKEVSVSGAKPLMKQEVDGLSYDIQADPESRSLSVLDMMRKVPLLSVDANDNILMKGTAKYKILINGRESSLVAKNAPDFLKSLPAYSIEKIVVITTPPAKYDAEGIAGIIDIITKRNTDDGYTFAVNTRLNTIYGPGANFNGTVKEGKLGLSFFGADGSSGKLTTAQGNTENIFATNTGIMQKGTMTQTAPFHYIGAELSFQVDTLNLITAAVDVNINKQAQHGPQNLLADSARIPVQSYTLFNSGYLNSKGYDASLNYQLGFKSSKEKLLTFSYKYSDAPNEQFSDNVFTNRYNYPLSIFPDFQQYNNSGNRDHTLQVDYSTPLDRSLSMEAGAKAILRNNYSNYNVANRDTVNNQYVTNDELTNDFNYHQNIFSLYNSYQLKLDKWSGKAGLRIERTAIDANFISAGVTTAPSYNNFIPSVSLQRDFAHSSINFGFTQRIQRPGILQLNPFVDRTNPSFVVTGNPQLKPELDNTFDFTYSAFGNNSLVADMSYAFSNNSIQNVSSLHTADSNGKPDTVTYTTFQNLGSNKTFGLNINTNVNITKRFSMYLNGQVNYVWLSGAFDGGLYHNSGFTGNLEGNFRYRFNKGYAIGLHFGYVSGQVNLQGESSGYLFNQYLLSKDFLNRRMTFALVVNDPYAKYFNINTTTNTAQFYQTAYNQNYYRSFAIRLNFRIGKLKSDITRNEHGIENNDTKESTKKAPTTN